MSQLVSVSWSPSINISSFQSNCMLPLMFRLQNGHSMQDYHDHWISPLIHGLNIRLDMCFSVQCRPQLSLQQMLQQNIGAFICRVLDTTGLNELLKFAPLIVHSREGSASFTKR